MPVPEYSSVKDYYKSGIKTNKPLVIDAFNWFHQDFKIENYPNAKFHAEIFYIDSLNSAIVYLWVKKL